ncbi:MAG: hypothetical protein R3D00_00335 [Bacteroidia bacterium]
MQKIHSEVDLRSVIEQLENKQAEEGKMLKQQFNLAYESIQPINLIKSTLQETAKSLEIREYIFNTSVGLAAGYLSNLLFVRVSKNPFKKLLGAALMFGVTNVVTHNPKVIKSLGAELLKMIINRPKLGEIEVEHKAIHETIS